MIRTQYRAARYREEGVRPAEFLQSPGIQRHGASPKEVYDDRNFQPVRADKNVCTQRDLKVTNLRVKVGFMKFPVGLHPMVQRAAVAQADSA